ncbi:hypothetical protein B0F90DRAFT_1726835 [Multifurca ochricompacta]|uniref:Cns1/TTC4 wheel domain-containing protein n=1 Tax=Multifurca ochricompacta TaxID=376703 RepID=A0AAD4M2J9_9AGAM|nr:hypothetical protein B0F90DRAFT_1726835 [Multifurca ochricompacta]
MSSLPEEDTDNVALSALQSLVHDGTPDEMAQNFKEQGNDYFKGKRYREALGFYTQGIEARPDDARLREALLLNRMACNLELHNYGSVLRDCATVIAANPRASKAYYRAGLALLALERVDETLDVCVRAVASATTARAGAGAGAGEGGRIANDGDATAFKTLRERAEKKAEELRKKEEVRAERAQRAEEEKMKMDAAFAVRVFFSSSSSLTYSLSLSLSTRRDRFFKDRNLINVPNPDGSSNPYAPKFDPEDATGRTLIMPVFFLYPEYATSDVIAEFVEDTPFGAHLAAMFPPGASAPPSWDDKGRYVDDGSSLVVYAITRRKRLLKVGRKLTLRDVCRAAGGGKTGKDGLEVKDGCLSEKYQIGIWSCLASHNISRR